MESVSIFSDLAFGVMLSAFGVGMMQSEGSLGLVVVCAGLRIISAGFESLTKYKRGAQA